MTYNTGKLLTILMLAVLLSSMAAWVIAYRYRKAMQRLMRSPAGAAAVHAPSVQVPAATLSAPAWTSLADNRRAGWRLSLLLIALSVLLAVSSAATWMWLAFPGEALPPKRVATVALLHLWPVIPALGLMWRWTRRRLMGVLALWCVFCFVVLLWRSIEPRPLQLVMGLAYEIGPAMVMVALLLLGSATRAIAPWLLLPLAGLVWASIMGIDALDLMVQQQSPLLLAMSGWVGAYEVMLAFALLPWLIAWWPLRRLGRLLGLAYARQWFSELMVVFTTVWAISLLERAVVVGSSAGFSAVAMFWPLLWIPAVMGLYKAVQPRRGRPPTLLVLRVFQRDAEVQSLFDHVIERWRLSGNTVMIAGTDLADRTIDADDIFTFLDRRLASRFIHAPADVAPRIAAFDMTPDLDGRYRVNECYCHDTTWQDALQALVRISDVVLMDLRGFQTHNAGCRYELDTLAQSPRVLRVVVLFDAQTDRAAAAAAIGQGNADRFVWLDAASVDGRKRREVLASLFDSPPVAGHVDNAAAHAIR
jgi:hypothetical protein